MSNLSSRILVAAIGIPLLLFCIVNGGMFLVALIVILQLAALWEWGRFAQASQIPFAAWKLLFPLCAIDLLVFDAIEQWSGAAAVLFMTFWVLLNVMDKSRKPLMTLGHGALYTIYAALPLVLWFPISSMSEPARFSEAGALFVLFAATWLCDSAAYFGGRAMGNHKLYVEASPNKTVEGAVFGILGSALLLPSLRWLGFAMPTVFDYVMLPLIVGVAGQAGDLIESLMKREIGIKDSSNLIPGHGGVLDRFDSLLLSSPFFFSYLYLTT